MDQNLFIYLFIYVLAAGASMNKNNFLDGFVNMRVEQIFVTASGMAKERSLVGGNQTYFKLHRLTFVVTNYPLFCLIPLPLV